MLLAHDAGKFGGFGVELWMLEAYIASHTESGVGLCVQSVVPLVMNSATEPAGADPARRAHINNCTAMRIL
jgi:hypothetical protein